MLARHFTKPFLISMPNSSPGDSNISCLPLTWSWLLLERALYKKSVTRNDEIHKKLLAVQQLFILWLEEEKGVASEKA